MIRRILHARRVILRAAEILEQNATVIFECNTIDGKWDTVGAESEHDELTSVAADLRGLLDRESPHGA